MHNVDRRKLSIWLVAGILLASFVPIGMSAMAYAQGQIAINALLQRFPKLAPATDRPQYGMSLTLRGLQSLPVAY